MRNRSLLLALALPSMLLQPSVQPVWEGGAEPKPRTPKRGKPTKAEKKAAKRARRAAGVLGAVKPGDCIHCGKEICNDLGWCNSFKAAPKDGVEGRKP